MAKEQIVNIQTGEIIVKENDSIKVVPITVDESMVQLRSIRNSILGQSDWMSFADSPSMSDEWKTYRQALRDITKGLDTVAKVEEKLKQDTDGNFVNFPTAPSE